MLSDEQLHRLLDIANAGCMKGHILEARAIYEGVLADRPGHVPALLGQAVSHMVVDEFDAAEAQFKAVLDAHPDDRDAKALLGMCYTLAGKKGEAGDLLSALQDGQDTSARLAADLLEAAR